MGTEMKDVKDKEGGEWVDEAMVAIEDDGDYIDYVKRTIKLVKFIFEGEEWSWPIVLEKILRHKYYFDKQEDERAVETPTTEHLSREQLLDRIGELVNGRKFRTTGDFARFANKLREIFGTQRTRDRKVVYKIWQELEDSDDLAEMESLLREMDYL